MHYFSLLDEAGEEKIAYAHPKGEVHRTSIEQANTIKNDATLKELQMIVTNLNKR